MESKTISDVVGIGTKATYNILVWRHAIKMFCIQFDFAI